MAISKFGDLLRAFRLRSGYGLREFAKMVGELPSNMSAVETGKRAPFRALDKLNRIAAALALQEGSRDWDQFFLAARKDDAFPQSLGQLLDRELHLALLRTVEKRKLSDEQLRELIDHVNGMSR